jgi:hypothetical protein
MVGRRVARCRRRRGQAVPHRQVVRRVQGVLLVVRLGVWMRVQEWFLSLNKPSSTRLALLSAPLVNTACDVDKGSLVMHF